MLLDKLEFSTPAVTAGHTVFHGDGTAAGRHETAMSALSHIADFGRTTLDVRKVPEGDIDQFHSMTSSAVASTRLAR